MGIQILNNLAIWLYMYDVYIVYKINLYRNIQQKSTHTHTTLIIYKQFEQHKVYIVCVCVCVF